MIFFFFFCFMIFHILLVISLKYSCVGLFCECGTVDIIAYMYGYEFSLISVQL